MPFPSVPVWISGVIFNFYMSQEGASTHTERISTGVEYRAERYKQLKGRELENWKTDKYRTTIGGTRRIQASLTSKKELNLPWEVQGMKTQVWYS